MQKNSQEFSPQEISQLAKSPAGQQLLAMLRSADPSKLQQATDSASRGDYAQASRIIQTLLSSADAQQLLKKFGR